MTHRRSSVFTCSALLTLIIQLWLLPTLARAGSPEHISLTRLSIANWLSEVGETRIVINGYITRLPASTFSGPSFALGKPSVPDTAAIQAFFTEHELALDNLRIADHSTSARDHLQAALSAAGLNSVDLWLGFSDRPLAEAVYQVLKPKAHIPHHWDGLFTSFFDGVPYAYSAFPQAAGVAEFWQAQQVTFLPQKQYLDKYVLTTEGVKAVENEAVKEKLGLEGSRSLSDGG